MRARRDRDADAAYLDLREDKADPIAGVGPRTVAKTYACDPAEVGGMINLDFDWEGRLIGIEVLDASVLLRPLLDKL